MIIAKLQDRANMMILRVVAAGVAAAPGAAMAGTDR